MERWKARLNIAADAAEPEQPAGEEPEAAAGAPPPAAEDEAEGGAGEYRFLGQQEQQAAGDTQALAPATEEQAAAQQQAQGTEEEHDGGDADAAAAAEEEAVGGEEAMDADQPPGEQQALVSGTANWGAGGDRKAGLEAGDAAAGEEAAADQQGDEPAEDKEGAATGEPDDEVAGEGTANESYVAARLQATSLDDGVSLAEQLGLAGLSEEAAAALREQLDARLRAASEGAAPLPDAAAEAHGREVWARCEALTAGGCVGCEAGGVVWLVGHEGTSSRIMQRRGAQLQVSSTPRAAQAWWASWRSSCA